MNPFTKYPLIAKALSAGALVINFIIPGAAKADVGKVDNGIASLPPQEAARTAEPPTLTEEIIPPAAPEKKGSFVDTIGRLESGRVNGDHYRAENRFGCLGKYQFCGSGLKIVGLKDKGGNWTMLAKSNGVRSKNDFLNNPEVQDWAVHDLARRNREYAEFLGVDKYVGMEVTAITGEIFVVDWAAIVVGFHLKPAGVVSFLKNGVDRNDPRQFDGNGTHVSIFMLAGAGHDVFGRDSLLFTRLPSSPGPDYYDELTLAGRILGKADNQVRDIMDRVYDTTSRIFGNGDAAAQEIFNRADSMVDRIMRGEGLGREK